MCCNALNVFQVISCNMVLIHKINHFHSISRIIQLYQLFVDFFVFLRWYQNFVNFLKYSGQYNGINTGYFVCIFYHFAAWVFSVMAAAPS